MKEKRNSNKREPNLKIKHKKTNSMYFLINPFKKQNNKQKKTKEDGSICKP